MKAEIFRGGLTYSPLGGSGGMLPQEILKNSML